MDFGTNEKSAYREKLDRPENQIFFNNKLELSKFWSRVPKAFLTKYFNPSNGDKDKM